MTKHRWRIQHWNENTRGGTNSRLDDTEGWISELEGKGGWGIDKEEKKEEWRNENLERELWDNIKHINMYIIGSQKEKREREIVIKMTKVKDEKRTVKAGKEKQQRNT